MTGHTKICPVTGLKWRISEHSSDALVCDDDRIASIEVSLNNPHCVGRFLAFQLVWAKKFFKKAEFAIGDTLQRHNYSSIGHETRGVLDPESAEAISREEGRQWCEQNASIIAQYWSGPSLIRRWDQWRAHPEFTDAVERSRRILTGETMSPLLFKDAKRFMARRGMKEFDPNSRIACGCSEYIIEEVAGYFLHSRDWPVVHIYAGRALDTLRYFSKNGKIPEASDVEFVDVMRARKYVNFELRDKEEIHA